ncbi:uncharacterized protein LOC144642117 [Oculina patagonica]
MGYTRALVTAILVAMTTEAAMGFIPYAVQSSIVDLMDESDFIGLQRVKFSRENVRPIYRKDMGVKEVAYFEIRDGGNFYVFSAGRYTGDHRLVESGNGTSPTELLNHRALIQGESCATHYRITAQSGLYTCENAQNVLVASTYDFVSDSPADCVNLENRNYWLYLNRNLRTNLSEFNKEWEDLYKETKDSAQWNTEELITPDQEDANITRYAEESLRPGSTVKVALGNQFSRLAIRVTGTGRNMSDNEPSLDELQRRLCQVLGEVCRDGSTVVNKEVIERTPNGISYIRLSVSEDKERVMKILQKAEVEFVVEFRIVDGGQDKLVRKRYAIDLSPCRKRRWSSWHYWSVPQEWRFPDYNQHTCCGCWSGCGPVAWAQIFGYFDRLAHASSSFGYSKHLYRCTNGVSGSSSCVAPSWTTTTVRKYVENIRSRVDTFCLFGGGATTHWDMADSKLKSWYSSRQSGGSIHAYTSWWSSLPGIYRSWIRDRAIQAVRQGYPAIVGFWSGSSQHYAVATRYRYRYRRYRYCWWFFGWHCGPWKYEYDRELYYHMGWGGSSNGWRKAKAFSAFAARK